MLGVAVFAVLVVILMLLIRVPSGDGDRSAQQGGDENPLQSMGETNGSSEPQEPEGSDRTPPAPEEPAEGEPARNPDPQTPAGNEGPHPKTQGPTKPGRRSVPGMTTKRYTIRWA